jgi:hypothetical protein
MLYSAHSGDAPAVIANSFSGQAAPITFRACRDADGNTHYFIRNPRPNRNGVCRVFEHEVFPGTEKDIVFVQLRYETVRPGWYTTIKGWKAWPSDDWALIHYQRQSSVLGFVTGADCPPGDDPRYIALGNVTDGMLTGFQKAWDMATRSPEALEKAFARVPTATSWTGDIDKVPSQGLRDILRSSIFERHARVGTITCDEGGCTAWLDRVSIAFDTTPSGIVFKALKAVWRA